MDRAVQPEWLDELPATDPRAIRARLDLRRVNAWMGNAATLARAWERAFPANAAAKVIELGAGDGTFFLSVARHLSRRRLAGAPRPRSRSVLFVDRQALVDALVRRQLNELGWTALVATADVFQFLQNGAKPVDAVVANLFLHHFTSAQLTQLLRLAAAKARAVIAIEPRRSCCVLLLSRCLRAIGCGAVTRHDAVISVRAGFNRSELSVLWPDVDGWELTESAAGFSSHLFVARRKA